MSSGEQTENGSCPSQTEDFSPPAHDHAEGTGNPGATSLLDILDLIVKFQLIGADSHTLITNLRSELAGQSERLLAGTLVERSYITEEELESVVLARYLLACGKITMIQLELVMDEIQDTKAPLWVALVAKGWLKMSDVV
jgi:hypothetical protein